jgi:hypothetical protein
MIPKLFLAPLLAAALLAASPARAAEPGRDDVQYPDTAATFATATREGAIVTPDVTYPGPHGAVEKALAPAPSGALAGSDDVVYPSADAPARVARATPRPDEARASEERLASGRARR